MPTFAKKLRSNPTLAEVRFWRLIHPIRTSWHFRRQAKIGPYIVDFASPGAKLAVQIDGDTHFVGQGPDHDKRRDSFLALQGYQILRFTNDEVLSNPEGVYHRLTEILTRKTPPS